MNEFAGSYFNAEIDLKAGREKQWSVPKGSSFVLNEGSGIIYCTVNGKRFRLREGQINDHRGNTFDHIYLTSSVDQRIDIRFGTEGMLVGPPQKEQISVSGSVEAILDEGDLAQLAIDIRDALPSHSISDYEDITVNAGETKTIIDSEPGVKETVIQRIDEVIANARIGAAPTSTKGLKVPRGGTLVITNGAQVKAKNTSDEVMTFSIMREKY